jgi:hypothetical protein
MTVEEELLKLEDDIRRLKIEYEVYFNGGSSRPPQDTVYRVETCIKRYSADQSKLNFGQRFRFNQLVQKYQVNHQLWSRKLRDKEEGRGQFAPRREEPVLVPEDGTIRVVLSDAAQQKEKIDLLLKAMVNAKRQVGENVEGLDPAVFARFVEQKTRQVKDSLGCDSVQFSVSVEDGKVKFKAVRGS